MRIGWITGALLVLSLTPLAWARAADGAPSQTTQTPAQRLAQDQQRLMRDEQQMQQDQRQLYQQEFGADQQQINQQMLEARREMQAAAQRLAQLTMQMSGPMMSRLSRAFDPNRAVLGVTIANTVPGRNGVGVEIAAVTPGGPAAQGGLRAGDVITAINGIAFKTNAREPASDQLLDLMDRVQPGAHLTLAYLRDGGTHTAQVTAGRLSDFGFAWNMPEMPAVQPANMRAIFAPWPWFGRGGPWAGMQLVALSPGLGQYFGTDKGLLVIRAPGNAALKLDDGDVILKIGDRQPATPSDAMRVLYSYGAGDTVTLHVLRKNKPLELSITVPPPATGAYQPMDFHR